MMMMMMMMMMVVVSRATFIPCFVEAAAVAGLSYFLLDFPLTVGLYCTLYTVLYCTVL